MKVDFFAKFVQGGLTTNVTLHFTAGTLINQCGYEYNRHKSQTDSSHWSFTTPRPNTFLLLARAEEKTFHSPGLYLRKDLGGKRMTDILPKKRVRRGIDRDREDERESLLDKPYHPPVHHAPSVKKNPSRVVPDFTGFSVLSSNEIGFDTKEIENNDDMIVISSAHERSRDKHEIKDGEREKDRISSGFARRSLRPPCAPESTLIKKIRRYFDWVNDPCRIAKDLDAYRVVVNDLHSELDELEMESIRWKASVNTLRAEYSNIHYFLSSKIKEQEQQESELTEILLDEVASMEDMLNKDGPIHGTRGKAIHSAEEVVARFHNIESSLVSAIKECLSMAKDSTSQSKELGGETVFDSETGEAILCSIERKKNGESRAELPVSTAQKINTETLNSHTDEAATGNEAICEGSSGNEAKTSKDTVSVIPDLHTLFSRIETKKRKAEQFSATDVFSESLYHTNKQFLLNGLPDDIDRSHNYFKAKRSQDKAPSASERQRIEAECIAAAARYSSASIDTYIKILQDQYDAVSDPNEKNIGDDAALGSSYDGFSKHRSRIPKGKINLSGNVTVIPMHISAMRRAPRDVPLFISPFSSLGGWYGGTYQPLEFPRGGHRTPSMPVNSERFQLPDTIQIGEECMSKINTLSSALQRAQVTLSDLEKEESEWKAQFASSTASLQKLRESLSAVEKESLSQIPPPPVEHEPKAGSNGHAEETKADCDGQEEDAEISNGATANGSSQSKKNTEVKKNSSTKKRTTGKRRR